jgi:hypothetical protein
MTHTARTQRHVKHAAYLVRFVGVCAYVQFRLRQLFM